jgi:hypothetical protein
MTEDKEVSAEEKKPFELARMTDDELREFVLGVCDGRIFTSRHCRDPEEVRMVFAILAFGLLKDLTREDAAQIGLFWEYLSEAGPLACNGLPMFLSVRMMHVDDAERAGKAIVSELARRGEIAV